MLGIPDNQIRYPGTPTCVVFTEQAADSRETMSANALPNRPRTLAFFQLTIRIRWATYPRYLQQILPLK